MVRRDDHHEGVVFAVAAVLAIIAAAGPTIADDVIRPATDRPAPKTPDESAKDVRLPPGFVFELVAAEPLLREPTHVCFDERRRLFVCEIHGYNLDGYLDIVELNKTGKLDRDVRRVRYASPQSQESAKRDTFGTVRMLSDRDGDGRMDRSDVWAERLPPCYGIIAARGGVIVICAPDIVFLADRDGDGVAEVRESLFTGFERELIERGINSPRWGLDNWIYVAAGGGGGTITGPSLGGPVEIGHTDFRFRPDGSAIEPVTGRESMFGLTMNDDGDRFHTIATQVTPLPYHYLARNPYVASPPGDVDLVPDREIFPISRPDPWRLARGQDPAWVKFYGETETKPHGFFTSSSGQLIYRADAFPEAFRGNYFVCDPANNLIHRRLLERDGATYTSRRAPGEEHSEFLASSDQWFRPMSLSIGPDGAIYVVDMYREVIEDFSAIPRFLQQQYAESLIAGKEHGRIWRLRYAGVSSTGAESRPPGDMDVNDASEWVPRLAHPNPWWRETAQRRIVELGDPAVQGRVREVAIGSKTPQGRVHALHTLDGLNAMDAAIVLAAMDDAHDGVRRHAVSLSDRWLNDDAALLDRVLKALDDPDSMVRLQAALSLGESRGPRAIDGLARFAVRHGAERWVVAAIASSVASRSGELLERLIEAAEGDPEMRPLLELLGETAGARRNADELGGALARVAAIGEERSATGVALLDGILRGLSRGTPDLVEGEAVTRAVERLLASDVELLRERALQLVGPMRLTESAAMGRAWDAAKAVGIDEQRSIDARITAVRILSTAPWSRMAGLESLLDARQPIELQLAVVSAIASAEDAAVADALFENWDGLAPRVRESVIDGLFARRNRLPRLLDAIERGDVLPSSLGALRREQLLEDADPGLRDRARSILARNTANDRAETVRRYASSLELPRDAGRGAAVFERTCARCHKMGDRGPDIGPNLSSARLRADATLISDIFDPSASLVSGYTVYSVVTTDGRVHTGLLADESATSILLRSAMEADAVRAAGSAAAVEYSVLRKDIESMRASSQSLMPDGLEKELAPQDVADLLGYLRESFGQAIPTGLSLFDDEQSVLDALKEGDAATITLDTNDRRFGRAAMRLTSGQRYSAKIAGWRYRIVEHPGPAAAGEPEQFRYARFAWKAAGADGLMIELAADGAWPPADQPVRRYLAGINSRPWKAKRVAPHAPSEWTIVTVDLWKDFGEFTLTGIGPVAMNGGGLFDRIELLRSLDDSNTGHPDR